MKQIRQLSKILFHLLDMIFDTHDNTLSVILHYAVSCHLTKHLFQLSLTHIKVPGNIRKTDIIIKILIQKQDNFPDDTILCPQRLQRQRLYL